MATILGKLSADNLGELRNLTGLPDLTGYYNCIKQYIYQKRQETVVLKIQSDEEFEVIDLQPFEKQQTCALERLDRFARNLGDPNPIKFIVLLSDLYLGSDEESDEESDEDFKRRHRFDLQEV